MAKSISEYQDLQPVKSCATRGLQSVLLRLTCNDSATDIAMDDTISEASTVRIPSDRTDDAAGYRSHARRKSTHQRRPERRTYYDGTDAYTRERGTHDKLLARKARKPSTPLTAGDMLPYALLCTAPLAIKYLWTGEEFWGTIGVNNEAEFYVVMINTTLIVLWLLMVIISGKCLSCCCCSRKTHFMVGFAWWIILACAWLPIMVTAVMLLRSSTDRHGTRRLLRTYLGPLLV